MSRFRVLFLLSCVTLLLCGFTFRSTEIKAYAENKRIVSSNHVSAQIHAPEEKEREKYFTSITVETGDTLYTIAEKYYTEEYKSIESYISEIKRVNGIRSDYIQQGAFLTIPYYG